MLEFMRNFGPKAATIGALGLALTLAGATTAAGQAESAESARAAEGMAGAPAAERIPADEQAGRLDRLDEPSRYASDGDEPTIDLDQLLRLPQSYAADGELRAGESPAKWRSRFFEAEEKLAAQRAELVRLQAELEGKAGDSGTWAAGAPGLSSPDPQNSTLSFKLRNDLRRAREAIEQAENDLRALRVEADLADVPDSWRE